MKQQIEVLVVDDSETSRSLLAHIIESDPKLKIVGFAKNSDEAFSWLSHNHPDVITMDIFMPKINGYEVTRKIMETSPIPIVIISSAYEEKNTEQTFKAMEAGALAILKKPEGHGSVEYELQAQEIIDTIKVIASVKCIKRHPKTQPIEIYDIPANIKAVAIGASLGGPVALGEILRVIKSSFPAPIFIVQHISLGFTKGFVKWLNESSNIPISLAKHGELALPQHVYMAPDNNQMEIKKGGIISLIETIGQQPSIDLLFHSIADAYGASAIGIILTGMGRDGAKELLYMKEKGAYTIAQDEESSVVFGMPKEAIDMHAVKKVLSLENIAQFLNRMVPDGQ